MLDALGKRGGGDRGTFIVGDERPPKTCPLVYSRGYPLLRIRMDGVPMRLVERNARLVSAKDYTSIISSQKHGRD